VLDILLDKGLVIDIFLRVSLVGIELLTVDARIVIASVDTYLRFAEAVNRLDGARESLFGSSDDDNDESDESESGSSGSSRSSRSRSSSGSGSRSRSRSSSRGRS
jgi:uncharacterized membrane protein YgcG